MQLIGEMLATVCHIPTIGYIFIFLFNELFSLMAWKFRVMFEINGIYQFPLYYIFMINYICLTPILLHTFPPFIYYHVIKTPIPHFLWRCHTGIILSIVHLSVTFCFCWHQPSVIPFKRHTLVKHFLFMATLFSCGFARAQWPNYEVPANIF